ncbi:polycystic kidney disease protein 1-like 2 isoform X2 [Chanos chanos]|uniref:Polycystic kidney disease protein 1-like 2 isoform X2 n=1 Tax=Chanos chanos TaxID=29144 RepID=A0A6J2UNM0_CHACN|nr:polycystic kidney disease protein 1-like 3 isoform X2 [Chanos chanos]
MHYQCMKVILLKTLPWAAGLSGICRCGIFWRTLPGPGKLPVCGVSLQRWLESSVIHKYNHAGVYTVGVECTTSEWHVTAQKMITIQEELGEFGVVRCYSMNQSMSSDNCMALYGSLMTVQVELDGGTNITYKIQHGETVLATSSAIRGIIPHNITLNPDVQQKLGIGCHQLNVVASNGVTAEDVSLALKLCLVEPVEGLTGSVMSEHIQCPVSELYVNVSMDRGAPAQLLFQVLGGNQSFSEMREIQNGSMQLFTIPNRIRGMLQVKVRAWNAFSAMDVDAGNTRVRCYRNSTGEHLRVQRNDNLEIRANPQNPAIGTNEVTLELNGLQGNPNLFTFSWSCSENCHCPVSTTQESHVISADCLPQPFRFSLYSVTATRRVGNRETQTATKCITVTPGADINVRIRCANCDPVNVNSGVNLQLDCEGCQKIFWFFEDTSAVSGPLSTCYADSNIKQLISKGQDVSSLTVPSNTLTAAQQNIKVVAYGTQGDRSGYDTFTIPLFTESTSVSPTSLSPTVPSLRPSTASASQTSPYQSPTPVRQLSCDISPSVGDVLSPFTITCTPVSFFCTAGPCTYSFSTANGNYLSSGNEPVGSLLFLPKGDINNNKILILVATVENTAGETINTTLSVQVGDSSLGSTVQDLQNIVSNQVLQLQQSGQLTGASLAQIYQSVSDRLNGNSTDEQEKNAREQLREEMLSNMGEVINGAPLRNPMEVQVAAGTLLSLTEQGDELTTAAQVQASSLLANLSESLALMTSEEVDTEQMLEVTTPIVEAAGNILKVSGKTDKQNEISAFLLDSMENVQNALLAGKKPNQEPAVLNTPEISVYVNRMSPDNLHKQSFNIQNSSAASFTLPALGAEIMSMREPVDVRMMSFGINPFSWSEGEPISGAVGGLSLTTENGSLIPVTNLPEEIEILLPRVETVEVNSTLLDLGNFSTLMINVTTPNTSLVLKLEPTEETALHLSLGFQNYPNETYYEAQTQMPQEGSSLEERYTWVLGPGDMTVEVGVYYLLVRPVVEAGVNSTNTSVFITSIAAQCKYWDESKTNWSDYGCRVGPLTTTLVTQCLCNHLTFFGSSFFVMPNLVDVSRTAELFATFVNNPVVVCFVGAIFLVYVVVVIWARRKDIQDASKVKVTVLGDNDPLAEYRYLLNISTGHRRGASTSSQVTVTLLGTEGESEPHHLTDLDKPVFERGGIDMFLLTTPFSLGELQGIRLWHDNSGDHPSWYVNKAMVQDLETGQKWHFLCSSWLSIDMGECVLDKVFPVATEADLKAFSNLFFMKTVKDFRDGHIWFSVISRPPNSNFTRVQRVSCCFSLLLCTMLTSIMFWGVPTDPSEQTMDLGHIEFTWQQVMIGIQSSIIMFPINLLIVSIFRNVRPRENKSEKPVKQQGKTEPTKQGKTGRVSPSQPPSPQSDHRELTPDAVIKDIKRIAQSLSKVMKSPTVRLEMESGKTADINTMLSMVEKIIQQQNRANGGFYSDSSKKEPSLALSLGSVNLQESSLCDSPERIPSDTQKCNLYSQYLYKQLQHVEKEMELLGPSCFSNPESYSQAVLKVQGMKGLLESQLSSSSGREQIARSPSPAEDSAEVDEKKCCQKGLPWWFVFVGWILVVATSGVSAYFTMMYGLTYGKDRSISWLISMVVSFFESLFITQPLKVLGFAVFFALVLKNPDQEEYGDVPITNTDGPDTVRIARRDSTCSFYQPPPPTDIERMRNNRIKEKKVFALIREILIYVGFLWMLLLVAYGQRDPNAYYLNQHIMKSFRNGISDSMSPKDVFTWANTTLLSNLFGQYPGFITDGNSKLVGNARLRQVRVRKSSCKIARSMHQSVHDCHAPYSWDIEDMGSYGPAWNHSQVGELNNSKAFFTPWRYQTQARLRAHPIWGGVALYRGGGFVADLGPDVQNASSLLQYLFDNTWVDMYTRAIFAEFTVYNANVNLFCIVTLMLETTAVGAFQYRSELQTVRLYQSTSGFHVFVMASEVIYFIFVLYYMFVQVQLMKQQKWAYFGNKWNLLELSIIILSWSALSVFIKRTLLGNQDVEYYQNHKDHFVSFYDTATADAALGYLIAFLVLLATIKLWHLLRLNPKLHMITATLQRAWNDISGFLVVMTIMFLAYSIACNLMYGWKLYSYRTLLHAAQTVVSLQLGIFNYEEILDYNPVLGAFLIGSCIIFMTFVVLNLFISVILVAFSEEQLHHKPSEEEEIVDLMLMKLCSLFGIKCKKKETEECIKVNHLTGHTTTPSVIS